MSCICQYFVASKDENKTEISTNTPQDGPSALENDINTDNSLQTDVSATELAAASAENWLLKKNLAEAQINIENLEGLVKTIMDKQNVLLAEMYNLKSLNQDLEEDSRLQRDFHTMERNAMIKELQDVKELLQKRSQLLKETLQRNNVLMAEVQDVNEKIYLMGMKYLRLKNERSYDSSEQSDSNKSSDENH